MPKWKPYTKKDLLEITQQRSRETKLGEVIRTGTDFTDAAVQVVILGIPEDIGVRANLGTGGTTTAWKAFLHAFLNIQATTSLPGDKCCVFGHLDCSELLSGLSTASTDRLREAVSSIDRQVEKQIREITSLGKFPIVIGGGHNNAYPIIKGAATGYYASGKILAPTLNVINLDAHSDFRAMEGRHSGNGFRYAFHEGYLDRYAVIGLHRNYNAQAIIDEIAVEQRILFTFWEDIYLEEKLTLAEAVQQAIRFTAPRKCGIELDMDSIANTLSSALTPSGITATDARRYLHRCARMTQPAYLHLCEGALKLDSGLQSSTTGKLLSYLVSDFIRALGQGSSSPVH